MRYTDALRLLIACITGFYISHGSVAGSITSSFLALGDTDDAIPPDTHGAVGPDHVMTVLNTQVRIQQKSGEQVRTQSLQSFWSPLGDTKPFDPKLAFDHRANRWIMVAAGNRGTEDSSVLLAVSDTSDPSGTWGFRKVRGETGTSRFVDYPSLGMNAKWLAVQYLERTSVSNLYATSQLLLFDRQNPLDGIGDPKKFTVETADYVLMPAMTWDDTATLYLASVPARADGPVQTLRLHAIREAAGRESLEVLRAFTLPHSWASKAPGVGNLVPQKGTSAKLHVQEAWMHTVVARNGSIWVCHPIFLPAENPTRAAIQWAELSETEVRQVGRIEDATRSYLYPSMAVGSGNDILIGFTVSSEFMFPSAGYAVRSGADPIGFMRPPVIFKDGAGPYFKTRETGKNRWGDYSNSIVDPIDANVFWTIQEYAELPQGDPAQDGSGRWGTWWARVQLPRGLTVTTRREESEIALVFETESGKRYRVEEGDRPGLGWRTIEEVTGSGEIRTFRFPITGSAKFFRIAAD